MIRPRAAKRRRRTEERPSLPRKQRRRIRPKRNQMMVFWFIIEKVNE